MDVPLGGAGGTCMATAAQDSNDYIIVSFHFIIQIFYDCIFTKKLVTLNYKNIQKRISQKDGKTLFWHRKLFDGLVKG